MSLEGLYYLAPEEPTDGMAQPTTRTERDTCQFKKTKAVMFFPRGIHQCQQHQAHYPGGTFYIPWKISFYFLQSYYCCLV